LPFQFSDVRPDVKYLSASVITFCPSILKMLILALVGFGSSNEITVLGLNGLG